jgi:hypothetical protein
MAERVRRLQLEYHSVLASMPPSVAIPSALLAIDSRMPVYVPLGQEQFGVSLASMEPSLLVVLIPL